jgi:hypothetical protein
MLAQISQLFRFVDERIKTKEFCAWAPVWKGDELAAEWPAPRRAHPLDTLLGVFLRKRFDGCG